MNYRYAITLYADGQKTDKINPEKISGTYLPHFPEEYTSIKLINLMIFVNSLKTIKNKGRISNPAKNNYSSICLPRNVAAI
jgi:hypothetical protein